MLTISNQISTTGGVHPVEVDKRRTKRIPLFHYSWAEVNAMAIMEFVHRKVEDKEQAYILSELIRYLEHPRSGAADFSDMGASWTNVRDAVAAGTLRRTDNGVAEVAARFDQLLRFSALRLQRELGKDVKVVLSRKEADDPNVRLETLKQSLTESGALQGTIRIANTISDMRVVTDLRTGRCSISVVIDAPTEGRALTRINWLRRQLSDAPDGLRVDVYSRMARNTTSELLKTIQADPAVLIPDPKVEITRFQLTATSTLGTKRGTGRGTYIDSVITAVDGFYRTVLQGLAPWAPRAPQLPKTGTVAEEAGIDIVTLTPGEETTLDQANTPPHDGLILDVTEPEVVNWETSPNQPRTTLADG